MPKTTDKDTAIDLRVYESEFNPWREQAVREDEFGRTFLCDYSDTRMIGVVQYRDTLPSEHSEAIRASRLTRSDIEGQERLHAHMKAFEESAERFRVAVENGTATFPFKQDRSYLVPILTWILVLLVIVAGLLAWWVR